MSNFAENLKKYRKRNNYSQKELGKSINFGYIAIANYESGRIQKGSVILRSLSLTFNFMLYSAFPAFL